MATLTASAAQSTSPALYNVNGMVARSIRVTNGANGTTVLSAGDVTRAIKVPQGAIIQDMLVAISSTVQSYTVNIGDGDDADRYFASQSLVLSQVVRLGGGTGAIQTGIGYTYSVEDTIDITWTTITSGTAADAVVTLTVFYTNANGG